CALAYRRGLFPPAARLRQDARAVVHVLDDAVTLAGRRLEALAVEDADAAAAVLDQLAVLQRGRRPRDADPAHAEHVREELLRQAEFVGAHPVARHEQPAREALLDLVKAVARRGLGNLGEQRVRVAVDALLQRRGLAHFPGEARRRHPQRAAGAL